VAAVAAEFALMPRTSRPTGLANLAEDIAQLVVRRLQHRRMLLQRRVPECGEGGDGLVDARVAG
jgi:hypothetical protein